MRKWPLHSSKIIANYWEFIIIFGFILGASLLLSWHGSNPEFIIWKDGDEWTFLGSIFRMFQGFSTLNPYLFFSFVFYNYGFAYFFSIMLSALGFLSTGHLGGAIVVARLWSAIPACLSLLLIGLESRRQIGRISSMILCVALALMPGFWFNALWFHPDWLMTFFIILSFVNLVKMKDFFDQNYWRSVIILALAVAIKFQAVTFVLIYPLLFILNSKDFLSFSAIKKIIVPGIKTISIFMGIFFSLNIYLLSRIGREVWWRMFQANMISNATNHGSYNSVTLFEKFHSAIGIYFIHPVIWLCLLVFIGLVLLSRWKQSPKKTYLAIYLMVLVNFLYIFFSINKAWQHYYLSIIFSIFFIFPQVLSYVRSRRWAMILLVSLLGMQLFYHWQFLLDVVRKQAIFSEVAEQKEQIIYQEIDSIFKDTRPGRPGILTDSCCAIPWQHWGRNYNEVRTIYGALTEQQITNEIGTIILEKDSIYLSDRAWSMLAIPKEHQQPYREGKALVSKLVAGSYGFRIVYSSTNILVFMR